MKKPEPPPSRFERMSPKEESALIIVLGVIGMILTAIVYVVARLLS